MAGGRDGGEYSGEPMKPFANRTDAGRRLVRRLEHYARRSDVLVLALPRGGLPVGYEVAKALGAPLDVLVIRKLGLPGQPELAMGAIASGGVRVLNPDVVDSLAIPEDVLERVAASEEAELERRDRAYRGNRPPPDVRGRVVILVDDGIATGSTVRAALRVLRAQAPARLVVAVPTAAREIFEELEQEADEVIVVMTPSPFMAISLWYDDFSQLTDEEVRRFLDEARREFSPSAGAAVEP